MSDTQTIKDRLDIVQLIQEYLPLKKAGANWKAPCPFHREKTPSFMVHPEKQIFHCFGCQKGGDIFTFIQEIEGMDFPEALKFLADRSGVKLENNFQSEIQKSQKNRILEINSKATYFFHRFLLDIPSAKKAREYLSERGLKSESIEKWQIGFIPDQWELLTQYLLKKGFGIEDLAISGLTIKRDGADVKTGRGYYDRFRGRVMFPLWDAHGNVVGFTGRILVETENSGGKYVNTPQTPVYDKSGVLYGLDKAKSGIKAEDLAVIVEGQMDVIACHQAGMNNVIAASGTALTPEQVKLIKRYSQNIAMAFDADSAGQKAAKRGIDVATQEGMNIKVIKIPDEAGKDADECLKKNPKVWFDAVKKAIYVMDWHFMSVLGKTNHLEPKEKQKVAAELLMEISKIPFAVEQDEWLKRLGEELGIENPILRTELKKIKNAGNRKFGNSDIVETGDDNTNKKNESKIALPNDRLGLLSSRLFSLVIKFPGIFTSRASEFKPEYFIHTNFASLYEILNNHYNTNNHPDSWSEVFVLANKDGLTDILAMQVERDYGDLDEDNAAKEAGALLEQIKAEWTKVRRREIQDELLKAERNGDKNAINELFSKLQQLI
ncbi:DNA primase [Patescibacteria group bacterium]|nr:DNA primase [Patescibacteria group bacterium]MBU1613095.1 DNA primase [Patescibacteria group bacterium]